MYVISVHELKWLLVPRWLTLRTEILWDKASEDRVPFKWNFHLFIDSHNDISKNTSYVWKNSIISLIIQLDIILVRIFVTFLERVYFSRCVNLCSYDFINLLLKLILIFFYKDSFTTTWPTLCVNKYWSIKVCDYMKKNHCHTLWAVLFKYQSAAQSDISRGFWV